MSRIYAQQKRPGVKAAEPSYDAPAVHAPSLVSGQSSSDLDALMQAKYRQHFLDNQIPTAEAEADRIAASVSGARTPEEVKTRLGEKMGADFSNVTFHTDSAALKQADAMGARAYTTGSDVYFGSGGFDPGVAAHELVHTVQQGMVGSSMGTTSAPVGGVQMMPRWLKKAGHGIKEFISPSDKSKGSIFDAPTRLINKAFGLPFKLFEKLGNLGSSAEPAEAEFEAPEEMDDPPIVNDENYAAIARTPVSVVQNINPPLDGRTAPSVPHVAPNKPLPPTPIRHIPPNKPLPPIPVPQEPAQEEQAGPGPFGRIRDAWNNPTSMLHPVQRHAAAQEGLKMFNNRLATSAYDDVINGPLLEGEDVKAQIRRAQQASMAARTEQFSRNPFKRHQKVKEMLAFAECEKAKVRSRDIIY